MVFEPFKVLKTSTKLWYQLKDQIGEQRGGEWEPQIRFEKTEEKSPDYTQRTSDEEYQYCIAQNGYQH